MCTSEDKDYNTMAYRRQDDNKKTQETDCYK